MMLFQVCLYAIFPSSDTLKVSDSTDEQGRRYVKWSKISLYLLLNHLLRLIFQLPRLPLVHDRVNHNPIFLYQPLGF
jgi:hypothetical protein